MNFFFTNFPPEWNKVDLQELFAEVGEIANVYVARKVSNAGKRFGFARFFRVGNLTALENRLNRIRIGNFKLKANIANCLREEWVFDVPSESKKSPTDKLSPTHHTSFESTLVDESFLIHSIFELQSIWLAFKATYCKVSNLSGSKFSLEFKNGVGCGLPGVDFKSPLKEHVKVDTKNNIVGSSDFPTEDGSKKADDNNVTSIFPAQVNEDENSKQSPRMNRVLLVVVIDGGSLIRMMVDNDCVDRNCLNMVIYDTICDLNVKKNNEKQFDDCVKHGENGIFLKSACDFENLSPNSKFDSQVSLLSEYHAKTKSKNFLKAIFKVYGHLGSNKLMGQIVMKKDHVQVLEPSEIKRELDEVLGMSEMKKKNRRYYQQVRQLRIMGLVFKKWPDILK
ncbi:hypothetical protein CTI12_AA577930 [Artemisia annua]|uniref:RRM domain-containing protein n=1 Tax=Artemisia annua TaxID=35608 RepID=A0A2U1KQ35_ARTAN|nr:hypothetical protein CTI12_AA577930 [Artemisia annua]